MSEPTIISHVSELAGWTQHEPISSRKRSHVSELCPPVSWRPGYKSGYTQVAQASCSAEAFRMATRGVVPRSMRCRSTLSTQPPPEITCRPAGKRR
jgi:hypothetical protein